MSNTSSRILRPEELGAVTNVWWVEASGEEPLAPKEAAKTSEVVMETTARQEWSEQEVYQRGFKEGRGVGHQQAMGELQPVLERVTRSLAELSTMRARIRKDA